MAEPVIIWGSGAIGGTIGAYLVRAGHSVIFVDVEEAHVAAIATGNLRIEGPIDQFTLGGPACTPAGLTGRYRTILMAVKAHVTREVAEQIAPHLAEDGGVVSLQNGLNELVIADVVGAHRTIGCFVNFSADWLEPGRILYGARSPLRIGELSGAVTPRILALRDVLRDFESDTEASDHIWGNIWGKAGYASMLAATALSNIPMVECIEDPANRHAITEVITEVLRVAVAEGVRPQGFQGYDPAAFLSGDAAAIDASLQANLVFKRRSAKKHSGYWRDLAVRQRGTDITAALAPLHAMAAKHGIPIPYVTRMLELIGAIERGEVEIGVPLLERLRQAG